MGTLVLFHAHPDDESIQTGGTAARAVAEGHRVVLVIATGGEHGEVPDDLPAGVTLAERRREEAARSAALLLGVHRLAWLGYEDSGMTGWAQNANAGAFTNAPLEEAAERLAAILREEAADVLTTYDWHGGYGHPDHIQVHKVGHRAAELAGTPRVYEATMNRDEIKRFMDLARAAGASDDDVFDPDGPMDDGNPMGTPEAELTTRVDVSAYVAVKRASIRAHASQITDTGFFSQMPDEQFAAAFGNEWFIRRGVPAGIAESWLFPVSVRVTLVRHGRAAAGWNVDPDPGLDELGWSQARAVGARLAPGGPLPLVSSPLRRCQETASPLAAAWGVTPVIEPLVAEIPSPDGVAMAERVDWLRDAMQGTWTALGPRYTAYRDAVVGRIAACPVDTVIVSHFIAINTVIGACVGDDRLVIASLDNCSCTVVEVGSDGRLRLVEQGHEADTLIR